MKFFIIFDFHFNPYSQKIIQGVMVLCCDSRLYNHTDGRWYERENEGNKEVNRSRKFKVSQYNGQRNNENRTTTIIHHIT